MKRKRRRRTTSGALLSLAGLAGRQAIGAGTAAGRPSLSRRAPTDRRSRMRWLATLLDGHVVALGVPGVELARSPDLLHRVLDHLVPLRHPADGARDGEEDGEH